MTKKGFTLMELLVSIFISGMVMLSLVAMWKTSSNHTAQAQRQSIIKNESTIFLRRIYADFVSASEVLCPWGYSTGNVSCRQDNIYIAVKEAVINPDDISQLIRITKNVCGSSGNAWATEDTLSAMASRCIKPSYVVYTFDSATNNVYRCSNTFLDNTDKTIAINTLITNAKSYCSNASNREIVMPYVSNFSLTQSADSSTVYPELLINYTINRDFGGDIPPVIFKFKRLLTRKRGI